MLFDQLKRREFITLLGERSGVMATRGAPAAGAHRPPTNIFLDAFRQGMRGHGYRRRVQQQVAELLKEAVPNVSRVAILCTAAWIEGTNSVCGGHIASRHPLRLTPWRRRNRRRSIPIAFA